MSLLLRAAYLKVCSRCESHAAILRGDEQLSVGFFTKAQGREALNALRAEGRIGVEEYGLISAEIDRCPLPDQVPNGVVDVIPVAFVQLPEEGTDDTETRVYH